MKKIGMLTIGQSPRNDITTSMSPALGDGFDILEAGALDDLTIEEIENIEIQPEDEILVTRMRDGKRVTITQRFLTPLLQQRIHELNNQGAQLIVIMCTGYFPFFASRSLVIAPQALLHTIIVTLLKKGKLGVICPAKEQLAAIEMEYTREGIDVLADYISPDANTSEIDALGERLARQHFDLIFLDCFAFNTDIKQRLIKKTAIPVIQSNSLVAAIIRAIA